MAKYEHALITAHDLLCSLQAVACDEDAAVIDGVVELIRETGVIDDGESES